MTNPNIPRPTRYDDQGQPSGLEDEETTRRYLADHAERTRHLENARQQWADLTALPTLRGMFKSDAPAVRTEGLHRDEVDRTAEQYRNNVVSWIYLEAQHGRTFASNADITGMVMDEYQHLNDAVYQSLPDDTVRDRDRINPFHDPRRFIGVGGAAIGGAAMTTVAEIAPVLNPLNVLIIGGTVAAATSKSHRPNRGEFTGTVGQDDMSEIQETVNASLADIGFDDQPDQEHRQPLTHQRLSVHLDRWLRERSHRVPLKQKVKHGVKSAKYDASLASKRDVAEQLRDILNGDPDIDVNFLRVMAAVDLTSDTIDNKRQNELRKDRQKRYLGRAGVFVVAAAATAITFSAAGEDGNAPPQKPPINHSTTDHIPEPTKSYGGIFPGDSGSSSPTK